LRRNRDELGAKRRDLAQHLLVGAKLEVAVGTPAAAIERHHCRTTAEQSREGDRPACGVWQREIRRVIAGLQSLFDWKSPLQLFDFGIVQLGPTRRSRANKLGAQGIQFSLQAHLRSSSLFLDHLI
jgi:hypothetical protein